METTQSHGFVYEVDTYKVKLSYSDLQRFPEYPESPILELSNGDLYIVPSPSPRHQSIALNLAYLIKSFLISNAIAKVFLPPIDVILDPHNVVVPDLVVLTSNQYQSITEKAITGVPMFIVEILSSNRHSDEVRKKSIYQSAGVKEYWIIDPESEIVEVNILLDGKYMSRKFSKENGAIRCETLSLDIELDGLFAE